MAFGTRVCQKIQNLKSAPLIHHQQYYIQSRSILSTNPSFSFGCKRWQVFLLLVSISFVFTCSSGSIGFFGLSFGDELLWSSGVMGVFSLL